VVEEGIGPAGEIALTLLSCLPDPCDCGIGILRPTETWVSLGELPPGPHSVRAGSFSANFVVP
jgi:hypothetical protein